MRGNKTEQEIQYNYIHWLDVLSVVTVVTIALCPPGVCIMGEASCIHGDISCIYDNFAMATSSASVCMKQSILLIAEVNIYWCNIEPLNCANRLANWLS